MKRVAVKKYSFCLFLMGFIVITAFANSQTTTVQTRVITQQTPKKISTHVVVTHHIHTQIILYSGSLRDNLQRIAAQYGWQQFVWNAPYDYNWIGTTRITAMDLTSAFQQILNNYPLQAMFYEGNRVLVIQPRTLR